MKRDPISHAVRLAAPLAVWLLAGCGGGPLVLESRWREQAITIDGIDSEWSGHVRSFEEARAVIGVMNDAEFVYLMMATTAPSAQFHLMRGLNIWFDPDGGEKKAFGIRYPVIEEQRMWAAREKAKARRSKQKEERMTDRFEELIGEMTDLEIHGAYGTIGRMPIGEAQGIEAKLRRTENVLIFEAKVPLAKRGRYFYAIGTSPGSRIGIGLESPKFKMSDVDAYDPIATNRGAGGIDGSGSRQPDDPGFGRPPDSPIRERPEAIFVWARLQLAAPPD